MTVVPESDQGMRLDAFVAKAAGVSRVRAAQLVTAGAVTVDGRLVPKAYKVRPGESVETLERAEVAAVYEMPDVPIVYEDEHLLVVDKPAGVVVHPAPGLREATVVDALAGGGRPLAPRAGEDRPGVVHRLDRDVSGLLLVAKTDETHEALVDAIAARKVRREYLGLVAGVPSVDTGKIEAPIGRNPKHRTKMAVIAEGRHAVTWFRVRERYPACTLLEVRLETGRTHQIRTHLASIGHPILGDAAYGHDPGLGRRLGLVRPFLHAFRLTLDHPATGEHLALRSDLPEDLRAALEKVRP